jgi:hypothetical protein
MQNPKEIERGVSRRRFLRYSAGAGLGMAVSLSGCGRIGLSGPSEVPPPEQQGLLSRKPETLYAPHGENGDWFNPWWPNPNGFFDYYKMRLFYRNEWLEAKSVQ